MTNKPSQVPPFLIEWYGDIDTLRALLEDHTLQFFAQTGIPELSEVGGRTYYTVKLTPQNNVPRKTLENYFREVESKKRTLGFIHSAEARVIPTPGNKKTELGEKRSQRTVRFKRKPIRGAVLQDNQRVPQVSTEEQKRRIQEQEHINRVGERDRLNIFPPGSNKQRCFKIRNGIRCEGTLELGIPFIDGGRYDWRRYITSGNISFATYMIVYYFPPH